MLTPESSNPAARDAIQAFSRRIECVLSGTSEFLVIQGWFPTGGTFADGYGSYLIISFVTCLKYIYCA